MRYLIVLFFFTIISKSYSQVAPVSYAQFLCPDQIYKNQMICLNERISEENKIGINPNYTNCFYSAASPAYNNQHYQSSASACPGICCIGSGIDQDALVNTKAFYNLKLKCINKPNKVSISKIDNFCWSVIYLDSGVFLFNIDIEVRHGREIDNYNCTDTTWDYSCGQDRTWKQLSVIIDNSISCNEYMDTTCNLIINGGFEDYTTCPTPQISNSSQQNINQLINWNRSKNTGISFPYHICGNYIGVNKQGATSMGIGNIPPQPFPSGGGYLRLGYTGNAGIGQFVNLCSSQKYRFSTFSMRGPTNAPSQDISLKGVNTTSFPSSNTFVNLATIPSGIINLYYNWHKFTADFTTTASYNSIVIEGGSYYDDISITPIDTVIFNTQLIANRCDSAEMMLNIPGCYGPYNLDVVVNTDTLSFAQIQDGFTIKIPLAKNNIVKVLSITNSLGCATILNTSDTLIVNNSGDASFTSTDFCEGQTNIITFLADTGILALVNNTTTATIDINTGIISGANGNQTFIISHAVCLDTVYDTIQVFNNSAGFTSSDICVGGVNTVTITGTTGGIFSLIPPTFGATIDINTGIVSGGISGNSYTIKYKVGNPCPDSLTQTIQVIAIEDPSFTTNDFCVNDSNIITITGTPNGTFSFSPTPIDSATIIADSGIISNATAGSTYTIKYVTPGACKDSSTQNVTTLVLPTSNIIGTGGDLCTSDSIPITVNLTGTPPWSITYTDGITPQAVSNITSSPYIIYAKTKGTYKIISITDSICSNSSDSTSVLIKGDSIMFWADVTSGCAPQQVKFWSNVTGINGDCLWILGDGDTINNCDTLYHTYQLAGNYSVKLDVTTPKCEGDTSFNNLIQLNINPEAIFYFTPQNPSVLNNTVSFTNNSIGNLNNEWFLNNSFVNNTANPDITFPATIGNHEICLIVENTFGCYDTTCSDIYVLDESLFYIPNAFIPNNDGLNDIFKPILSNTSNYNLKIFNRWGKLFFETNDPNEGWDGKQNGTMSMEGMYVYRITYRFNGNFDDQYLQGHFILIK